MLRRCRCHQNQVKSWKGSPVGGVRPCPWTGDWERMRVRSSCVWHVLGSGRIRGMAGPSPRPLVYPGGFLRFCILNGRLRWRSGWVNLECLAEPGGKSLLSVGQAGSQEEPAPWRRGVYMCVGALNVYEMGQGIPFQPQRGDSEDPCRESLGVTCPQAMGEAYVHLLPLLSLFSPQSVGLCP